MMTREEAIKALRLERGIEINGNAVRVAEFLQGLDVAISALRPVSREQVERVWYRRGWKYDNLRADGGIVYSATNTCMYCGSETPIGNFCYRCGIAQTDMGVDVVIERVEALYEKID